MDEAKTFVLLANQRENSLLRNRITFELADALKLPYAPDCRSVDLFIHGEYRGSCLLADKVSISLSSVDIVELEKEIERLNEAFLDHGGEPETYGKRSNSAMSRRIPALSASAGRRSSSSPRSR